MYRAIVVLIVFLFSWSCATDGNTLESWGRSGKVHNLINFIKTNHASSEQRDLVKVAIAQIVANDLYLGIVYLRENTNNIAAANLLRYTLQLRNSRKNGKSFLHNTLMDMVNDKTPAIQNYGALLDSSGLASTGIQESNDLIKSILDESRTLKFLEKQTTSLELDSLNSGSRISSTRRDLNTVLEDLEDFDWRKTRIVRLTGFINQQMEPQLYEITVPGLRQHALLRATDTHFQSSGTFSLEAFSTQETFPVDVEGGFTQNVPLYVEVGQEFYSNYSDIRNEVATFRSTLNQLEQQQVNIPNLLRTSRVAFQQSSMLFTSQKELLSQILDN